MNTNLQERIERVRTPIEFEWKRVIYSHKDWDDVLNNYILVMHPELKANPPSRETYIHNRFKAMKYLIESEFMRKTHHK